MSRPLPTLSALAAALLLAFTCAACCGGEEEGEEVEEEGEEGEGGEGEGEGEGEAAEEAPKESERVAPEGAVIGADGITRHVVGEGETFAVLEAAVCESVDRGTRLPVGAGERFALGLGKLSFWMSVRNGTDGEVEVFVVWKKEGVEQARTDLEIGVGKGWRTWAHKRLRKADVGRWTVEVQLGDGRVLQTYPVEIVE